MCRKIELMCIFLFMENCSQSDYFKLFFVFPLKGHMHAYEYGGYMCIK